MAVPPNATYFCIRVRKTWSLYL